MKIGIISDTHDNLLMTDKAVEAFKKENVEIVLHAGDHIAPFTSMIWEKLKVEVFGVFGNNDGDQAFLKKKFRKIGGIYEGPREFILGGKKILVMHEPDNMREIAASEKYDIVIYGHTHRKEIYSHGKTIVINPGEACGWITGTATAAVIDTETLETKEIELGKSPLGPLVV